MRISRGCSIGGSVAGDGWELLYCHLITCFNWSWEYIDDHMTLPRLDALREYWKSNPPLHQIMAAYAGFKPTEVPEEKENNLADFMAATQGL